MKKMESKSDQEKIKELEMHIKTIEYKINEFMRIDAALMRALDNTHKSNQKTIHVVTLLIVVTIINILVTFLKG